MAKAIVAPGTVFGKLTVIEEAEPYRLPSSGKPRRVMLCRCSCAKQTVVKCRLGHLRSGAIVSCGCHKDSLAAARQKTHGRSHTSTYLVWRHMMTRCYNKKSLSYIDYGARGITVCSEWHSYMPFEIWALSHGYDPSLEIDRRDNDGNYCPENCRFVTHKVNSRNTRHVSLYAAFGKTRCISEWAEEFGWNAHSLLTRILRGWTMEEALTIPLGMKRSQWKKLAIQKA